MSAKPRALYLCQQGHTDKVFRPETFERFQDRFQVWLRPVSDVAMNRQLEKRIASADAIVTGWGTAPFDAAHLAQAKKLQIIAHSAGSVKYLFPGDIVQKTLIPRGIIVFSGNHAIAYNVAESALGLMIACARDFSEYTIHCRESGGWRTDALRTNPQGLHGAVVGVVGASKVGREMLKLLKPFDCTVLVYDPYLSDYEAGALGIQKASLNEVFERSDYITVHAPQTDETHHMIRGAHLKKMKDGAVLVNTSRGSVLDEKALVAELKTGRIRAALDVTDPEPPVDDHPFRRMTNVMLLPHLSGAGKYGYLKIGELALQALEDHFAGRPVEGAVNLAQLERIG